MRRFFAHAMAGCILCGCVLILTIRPVSASDDEEEALKAERMFAQAVAKLDKAVLEKLLDQNFIWTDANGHTFTREQVLQNLPKPGIGEEAAAEVVKHNYGLLETVQEHKGRDNALHVWVKRPAGWQQLIYQETRLMDTTPTAPPGTGKTCENPCKTVPYEPKNANERDVLRAFQALQTATVAHDSAHWGLYVADEFAAANSNSNQVLNKQGRMADLERNKMAGYSPMPIQSMRLFEFGDGFVLASDHQPEHGKPVHVTRVWIKRNGKWMEAASYQTRVEGAPAKP